MSKGMIFGILTGVAFSVNCVLAAPPSVRDTIYDQAGRGNLAALQQLRAQGYSLDAQDRNGNTPLCQAIIQKNARAIQTLKAAGANVNHRCVEAVEGSAGAVAVSGVVAGSAGVVASSVNNKNRIYKLASEQDVPALVSIQKSGINVDSVDSKGNTALCQAVYDNNCPAISTLLGQGASKYHTCMRAIPQKVRDALTCMPPAEIDWVLIGNVTAGAAVIGGVIALASGGGGGGGTTCGINEYAVEGVCRCVANAVRDSSGTCRFIAPSPNRLSGDALKSAAKAYETEEYSNGNFLQHIHASSAYAQGYDGRVISRVEGDSWGGLEKIPVLDADGNETGEQTYYTDKKIVVGTLSTGVDISDNGAHKDLINQIVTDKDGNRVGYNFAYPVCADWASPAGNCYFVKNGNLYLNTTENAPSGVDTPFGTSVLVGSIGSINSVDELKNYLVNEWGYSVDNVDSTKNNRYDSAPNMHQNVAACSATTTGFCYIDNNGFREIWKYTASGGKTLVYYPDAGTTLAGIVGAEKNDEGMHGVNPNVEIIPAVVGFTAARYDTFKTLIDGDEAKGIPGVDIILLGQADVTTSDTKTQASHAIGRTTMAVYDWDTKLAYEHAAENNTVVIVGVGNQNDNYNDAGAPNTDVTNYEASITAGVGLTSDLGAALKDLFISVAAVEKRGDTYVLTDYSQTCGATKAYCIAAPGGINSLSGGINSTVDAGRSEYGTSWGTSNAAAVIAGSVSLLMSAYPHLTPQEVVRLMFETADDLGNVGIDDVYGNGMVNLDRATQPVGNLWIASGDSTMSISNRLVARSSINMLPISDLSAMQHATQSFNFMALDDYRRAYYFPLSSLVSVRSVQQQDFKDYFKSFMNGNGITRVQPTENFAMAFAARSSKRTTNMPMGNMELTYTTDNGSSFNMFFTEDTITARGEYFDRNLRNPFINMHEAYGFENAYNLMDGLGINFGYVSGQNGFFGDEADKGYSLPQNKMQAFTMGADYEPLDGMTFKTVGGLLAEDGSTLGMYGSGAFDSAASKTYFMGAGVSIKPTQKWTIDAMYYYGLTQTDMSDSLMTWGDLVSDSFALNTSYQFDDHRLLGFQISSPLRLRQGTATFDLPVTRSDTDEVVYRAQFDVDLKPQAREWNLGLYWRDQIGKAWQVQSEVGMRLNPDHKADVLPDYRALFGLKWVY